MKFMNHYLYLLTFPDGMRYVGAHSTKIEPQLDATYLGSGTRLPKNRTPQNCQKTLLGSFPTREALMQAEITFIQQNQCCRSDDWYNQREKTFDKHGLSGSQANKGRTKNTHTYIEQANQKRQLYVGNNRTPAQKADDEKKRGKSTGENLAKGHKGTDNCAFIPWYYISPEGEYKEVLDKTKREIAEKLGFTKRQLTHRFHRSNQHKPGKTHPFKGWIFGNLPRPDGTESNESV